MSEFIADGSLLVFLRVELGLQLVGDLLLLPLQAGHGGLLLTGEPCHLVCYAQLLPLDVEALTLQAVGLADDTFLLQGQALRAPENIQLPITQLQLSANQAPLLTEHPELSAIGIQADELAGDLTSSLLRLNPLDLNFALLDLELLLLDFLLAQLNLQLRLQHLAFGAKQRPPLVDPLLLLLLRQVVAPLFGRQSRLGRCSQLDRKPSPAHGQPTPGLGQLIHGLLHALLDLHQSEALLQAFHLVVQPVGDQLRHLPLLLELLVILRCPIAI